MGKAVLKQRSLKEGLSEMERTAGRAGSDTLRLWEFYKNQALLWRALALLQIPGTALALVMAILMFVTRTQIFNIPEKPLAGYFSVKDLPDAEFVNFATNLVNTAYTYQYVNAERQLTSARRYLWEPALSEYDKRVLGDEMRIISQTARSQMFFIDEGLTKVIRRSNDGKVTVRFVGTMQRLLGTETARPQEMVIYVKMSTVPRTVENEYGIVAVDLRINETRRDDVISDDNKERKRELRAQSKVKE